MSCDGGTQNMSLTGEFSPVFPSPKILLKLTCVYVVFESHPWQTKNQVLTEFHLCAARRKDWVLDNQLKHRRWKEVELFLLCLTWFSTHLESKCRRCNLEQVTLKCVFRWQITICIGRWAVHQCISIGTRHQNMFFLIVVVCQLDFESAYFHKCFHHFSSVCPRIVSLTEFQVKIQMANCSCWKSKTCSEKWEQRM